MLSYDYLLIFMASRKGGVSRQEFINTCEKYGVPFKQHRWNYQVNRHINKLPSSIYNIESRWYAHESEYYKMVVQFVHDNQKGEVKLPGLLGKVPEWIIMNHDLFVEMFKPTDF